MTSMIEKALTTATVIEDGEIGELAGEIARLQSLESSLLPIETQARATVLGEIEAKKSKVERVRSGQALGLPRLDTSVFAWNKRQRAWKSWGTHVYLFVPTFAYIPLDAQVLQLSTNRHGMDDSRSIVPKPVLAQYKKIMDRIGKEHCTGKKIQSVKLTYAYTGVIPTHVRNIIRKEQDGVLGERRFNQLALVCEVDSWQITKTERPPRELLDPILVGAKADSLWVLASFDPTTVEQYLLSEFTSKEVQQNA